MPENLGRKKPKIDFTLNTGEDYVRVFNLTEGTFPAGTHLYYLIGDTEERWDFDIAGTVVTVRKESEVADLVENNTPYRWFMSVDGTPSTETMLCYGVIKREPR